jgi:exodeoxyribonuclease-3
MKIITWNINSVRIRLDQLSEIINELDPDVICLQETKCDNKYFPIREIQSLGYKYIAINGQPSYNGVAILSRLKFTEVLNRDFYNKNDCRYIGAKFKYPKVKNDLLVHNFYVPAGGDEPDPDINAKFLHKLEFLDEMNSYLKEQFQENPHHVIVGDMNIAPHINDVWSHKQLINVVSHTVIERNKLTSIIQDNKLIDIMRYDVADEEKVFSWWSYRNRDWKKSNRGRRLDHIWITKDLVDHYKDHSIFTNTRDFTRPSDHVPVLIEI